ncbi:MAG: GNAT family N-acetyltransferase [Burkholderiaceae bacterium]
MRLNTITPGATPGFPKLALGLATTAAEIEEVQRLRYRVFVDATGLPALQNAEGLERDEFDPYCDHLLVRDRKTLKVVGTYRILGPAAARRIGRLYAETEFDLSRLTHLRPRLAEAGRACIHPDYRGGNVLMLLWAGLAAYLRREHCDFLTGCASVSLADGGRNAAAIHHALAPHQIAPAEYRAVPHLPLPLPDAAACGAPAMPPLLQGYLRSGAWVCGAPAWDPDFHCADFLLLLPLSRLEQRYARRYLRENRPARDAEREFA